MFPFLLPRYPKSENATLRNEINILNDKVRSLESPSSLSQSTSQINIVHKTTYFRLQKATNLIFLNIDKPDSNDPQIPLETAKELVSILDIQVLILTARWIGKISLKNLPLLIELNDTSSVIKLFKLKFKLRAILRIRNNLK